MAESIDQLQIDIQAQAVKANNAIDKFIGKLDRLSTSLEKIDYSKITGLANSVNKLSSSMQGMNNVRTADFTRLANNIQKLGNINVSALNSAASSMSHITRAFSGLGTVSANAQAVGDMAKNISKLGNKSVQTAITNMPRLATAMDNLMKTLSKSPQVSNNIIQMTNALATFVSQGNKINSAVNSITNGLNRTNTAVVKTTKNSFGLSSAIGKFYQLYFIIGRVANGLYGSITDTSNYIEAFNYYTVAFDKIASEWDSLYEGYGSENAQKYTNTFVTQMNEELGKMSGVKLNLSADMESGMLSSSGSKNLALNLQEVTQYASQLASITNSVGQNGTISATASSVFTKLAGDMSSLFNVDYSSVANNLQSGLIGQSRALYKYGIDITNATLQTKAYELGVEKAVSEMTQAEKMQLRMIAILEQSEVAWGDLADTINTPANMLRQWTNNLKEASMMLGQLFMPLLEKVLPVMNGITIALKNFLSNIDGFMGIKIDLSSMGSGTSDVLEELEDVTSGYEDATAAAEEYKNQILDFDEITKLQDTNTGTGSTSSSGSSIDLTDEIIDVASEYEKVWNEAFANMENKAEKFAERFAVVFTPVEKLFSHISVGDWVSVGEDTSEITSGIFNFFSDAISDVEWEELGNHTGEFISGLNWFDIVTSAIELSWNAGMSLTDFLIGLIDELDYEKFRKDLIEGFITMDWGEVVVGMFEGIFKLDELIDKMNLDKLFPQYAPSIKGISLAVDIFEKLHEVDWDKVKEDTKKNWGDFTLTVKMGAENIKLKVSEKWDELVEWWNSRPSLKDIEFNLSDLPGSISKLWEDARTWWKNKPTLTAVGFAISDLKTEISEKWDKVLNFWQRKTGLSKISAPIMDFLQSIKDAWNNVKIWWSNNASLSQITAKIKMPHLSVTWDTTGWAAEALQKLGLKGFPNFEVAYYASGGFPEDGWFRASKGEYFGKFDDGTSYIANNNQIVDGVASGVSRGVLMASAELNELLREQNELLRQILAKDIGISSRAAFNAVRKEAQNYSRQTGYPAFG